MGVSPHSHGENIGCAIYRKLGIHRSRNAGATRVAVPSSRRNLTVDARHCGGDAYETFARGRHIRCQSRSQKRQKRQPLFPSMCLHLAPRGADRLVSADCAEGDGVLQSAWGHRGGPYLIFFAYLDLRREANFFIRLQINESAACISSSTITNTPASDLYCVYFTGRNMRVFLPGNEGYCRRTQAAA